jgi:long-chain acyl-CoA synthetase
VWHWILLTGAAEGALSLERLREQGREALAEDPSLLSQLQAEAEPSDPAILYLPSGATGEPKKVMATHRAVVANIDMSPAALPLGPSDATVVFLPSAHIAQRVVMEFRPLGCGRPVTFSEIVTCVRWNLWFCLSFRDLEEIMAGRGLAVDHTTIWR